MLSRVAENIYWLARYVERAENTARLISVNTNLLLDLPRGIAPGWGPLVAISGSVEPYAAAHGEDYGERQVMRFLLGERENPSSILSSLFGARENARTIRDIVPREAWELINELYLYAKDELNAGLTKKGRHGYLKHVILRAQTLTGLLAGTMLHDAGYDFLRIGRNLERADMTTRIIDVRTAGLLPAEASELRPFENIQWMSVLRSLTAYQMYRRSRQLRISRSEVLRFLFQSLEFPRAVYHCADAVEESLVRLPNNEAPLRVLGRLKRQVHEADVAALQQEELHAFIDELQLALSDLHNELERTYFRPQAQPQAAAAGAA